MKVKLEVFETKASGSGTVVLQSTEIEEARLKSYELGYAAGWEDAVAATRDEVGRLDAELANNLQHLGFTYQQARQHILTSIRPVVQELATRLLPELSREALAPVVLDTLMPLIDDAADQPISLKLNPVARPAVERLLSQAAGLPLVIEEEATLGEGQVYLRLGEAEYRVDLGHAATEIIKAVHDFFDYSERDESDG